MKVCSGRSFWGNSEGKAYFMESLELWRQALSGWGNVFSSIGDLEAAAPW